MTTAEQYDDTDVPPLRMVTTIPDAPTNIEKHSSRPVVVTSSSSSSLWPRCTAVLARVGAWVSRRRWELTPAAGTTALTALGLVQGGYGPASAYGLLAVGAGAAAVHGVKNKNELFAKIGGGAFLALADIATAAAAGFSWPTLTAYGVTTGAGYVVYGPWLAEQRNKRMKLQLDTVKAKGAVPAAMGLDAADPGLIGGTPEETALRRALHALTGSAPSDVLAFQRTEHGWSALVVMPMGRNTSPDSIIRRKAQLASNLGMPGRLTLRKGDDENQLIVRLSRVDVLADLIPWTGPSITSVTEPMLLGYDADGVETRQTLYRNHVFIAGASDNGKSGAVNLIMCNLINCTDVDVHGIDLKAGTPELGVYRPVLKSLAATPAQARALLEGIEREYYRRGAILGGLSADGMPVRQWVPSKHGMQIVVVMDELAELIEQDPKLAVLLRRLVALVRYVGITFVCATQTPSAKVFGGDKDGAANFQVQIGFRVVSPTQTNIVMGAGMHGQGWRLSDLTGPGQSMVRSRENPTPRVTKFIYTTDADISEMVGVWHSDMKDTEPQPAITDEPWVELAAPQRYPDGTTVARDQWPDLYRVFREMGSATKDELRERGGYSSRDTVRRALDVWAQHGVQSRREGRSTRFYLPTQPSGR